MFSLPDRSRSASLVVERVGPAQATMYLDHPLTAADAHELRHLTQALPPAVRVLRVQVRAADVNQHVMDALRDVVRAWRWHGNIHLVFVGGFSPSREQVVVRAPVVIPDPDWGAAAHTAAFL